MFRFTVLEAPPQHTHTALPCPLWQEPDMEEKSGLYHGRQLQGKEKRQKFGGSRDKRKAYKILLQVICFLQLHSSFQNFPKQFHKWAQVFLMFEHLANI